MSETEFKPCVLHRVVLADVSLTAALLRASSGITSGMFYAPHFRLARLNYLSDAKTLLIEWDSDSAESTLSSVNAAHDDYLDSVYEARCFSEAMELTWWRDPSDSAAGRAVYVWEEGPGIQAADEPEDKIPCLHKQANAYLLWGGIDSRNGGGPRPHWGTLQSKRIGSLSIPYAASSSGRRWLQTVEYFGTAATVAGDMGNTGLLYERLVRWTDEKPAITEGPHR